MKHPIQPIEFDPHGVARFKQNKIVRHLLGTHPTCGMNEILAMEFSDDDLRQLCQLIGYSLSGYGSLSFVRDEDYYAAEASYTENVDDRDARIAALDKTIADLRGKVRALREPFDEVFDMAGEE